MKKMIFSAVFLLFTTLPLVAQKKDSSSINQARDLHKYYMEKHKRQLKTGTAIAITGSILMMGGYTSAAVTFINGNEEAAGGLLVIASLGMFAVVASIPVFISARSNLNKARLMLKAEHIKNDHTLLGKASYPALSLTIKL